MPTAVPAAPGIVHTSGLVTILAEPGKDPELCLGGVAASFPPQCGGPVIAGFDWADHRGTFEEANGVRWAEYAVTGRFDGSRFALTDAIPAALYDPVAPDDEPDFRTPCPEPDGGWRVIDPDRTTEESMSAAAELAAGLPGYVDSWLDQSRNPANQSSDEEPGMNDPRLLTFNIRVAKDPEGAEQALRKVWGGALCVSTAEHSAAELAKVQDEALDLPGMLSSGAATPPANHVEVQVVYDDGSLQAWADATYGEGLVRISSALVPASG